MLWGGATDCELELRAGRGKSRRLKGRFPYKKRAVLSDGGEKGRPQKEEFAPMAFAYRVDDPKADIHLLLGHDYDRPLASRGAGTIEPPRVYRRVICSTTRRPYRVSSGLHGTSPLLLRVGRSR